MILAQKLHTDKLKGVAIDTDRKMSKESQLKTGEVQQLRGRAGQLN